MPETWKVVAYPRLERDLDAVAPAYRARLASSLRRLAADPRPRGCRKLSGAADAWRVRVGPYRIVYEIDDLARVVTVIRVGHRGDVYR